MLSAKKCLLAASAGILALGSSAWGATNLPLGQVTTGTVISQSGIAQPTRYTFSAGTGDIVSFLLVATSGSLVPEIQLYTSTGTLIASNYAGSPFACSGTQVSLSNVQLPASTGGTYGVWVEDCNGANGGNYSLYGQRTNNPEGLVGSIGFGSEETGDITAVAQTDTYAFAANANDEMDFTVDATSGTMVPQITVFNPNGTQLATNYAGSPFACSGTDVQINTVQLPTTGSYTVLIDDCNHINSGNYEIYAQRTNAPGGSVVPLIFDQVQTGTISAETQKNTFTFSANASDMMYFTIDTTSGSLIPAITLYTPAGTILASNYSGSPFACSGTLVQLNGVSLPTKGTYTVLVGDCSTTNTGTYDIFAQRSNNPTGAVNLPFGEAIAGLIGAETQSVPYTFSATAKDVMDFTLVTTNGSLVPDLQVFSPTGVSIGSVYSGSPFACSGSDAELNGLTLPVTGTYTVFVSDCATTNTGNYELYAQRTNNPTGASPVLWGQVQTGTVGAVAQRTAYTFTGSSGNTVDFTVTGTTQGSSFIPKIWLYNPDGSQLAYNYSGSPFGCGGTSTSLSSVALAQNGTYTALIADCNDKNTGNFSLISECFGTCPTPAPILTSISPTNVVAGTGGLTLTANGANFVNQYVNSVVQWDNSDRTSAWVSTSQMTAQIPGTDTAAAGIYPITVYTPPPGGGTSNPINFTVYNPVPTATSLSPATKPEGGASFTLTVHGTNFTPNTNNTGSYVQWNGLSLATAYVGSTEVQATVPASDMQTPEIAQVTVFNPAPGGGMSAPALTFTVTPKVTWATPAPIIYGTALGSAQLDASSKVAGTFAYSPAAGTVLGAGKQTLCVTFTPTNPAYPPASDCVTLTVNRAPVTLSWPAPAPIVYGTALSATQLDATASVPGTFKYSPAAGTVLAAGIHTLNLTFIPTDKTDYQSPSMSNTITVNQKTPLLTWATPAAIGYGTPLGTNQLDAAAKLPGTFAYSPAAGTVLTAGSQTLSVLFTPTNTTDYTTATDSVTLTVNPAPAPVSWQPPAPILYGTPLSATQLDATSTVPGSFVYSPPAGTVLAAGTKTLYVTFTPTDTVDYKARRISTTITVNQKTPSLTWATPAATSYGTPLSSKQLDAAAKVPGTFAYSPAAGAILTAGTHTLTVTFTPTNTTDYTSATDSVTLTVNPVLAPVSWTTPAPIPYPTPLSATQLDASSTVAGSFVYSPHLGTVLKAGTHTLYVTFTPTDTVDYKVHTISTTLVVNPAP